MPTAWDLPGRTSKDDRNPLTGLLNFNDTDSAIEQAGSTFRDGLVPLLSSLLGFDMSGLGGLLAPVFDIIGGLLEVFGGLVEPLLSFLSLIPNLFNGIDLSNPLNLNPITLTLQLITNFINILSDAPALIEGIFQAVMEWFDNIVGLATTFVTSALQWIVNIPSLATAVINTLLGFVEVIPEFITSLINAGLYWITESTGLISTVINTALSWVSGTSGLADVIIAAVVEWVDNIPALASTVINAIMGWITTAPTLITTVIDAALSWLTEIPELASSLVNAALGWVTAVPELITTVIQAGLMWFTAIPDLVAELISTFIDLITTAPLLITQIFESVLGWVTDDSSDSLATTLITSLLSWVTAIPDLAEVVVQSALLWVTLLPDLASSVINAALGWISDIPELATSIINTVVSLITTIPDVAVNIIQALSALALEVPAFVVGLIEAIIGWITDIPELIQTVIGSALGWVTGDGSGGLQTSIVETALGWVTSIPTLIETVFVAIVGWIGELPEIASEVIEAVMDLITTIPTLASSVVNALLGVVTSLPELAVAVINGVVAWFTAAPELVVTLINSILELVTEIPDLIIGIINSLLGWVTGDGTGGIATSIVQTIIDAVTEIPELILSVISSLLGWITDAPALIEMVISSGLAWISALPEMIQSVIEAAVSWVAEVPQMAGAILEAVVELIQQAPEIAGSIVQAMVAIISIAPQLIFDVIAAVLSWIDDITGLNLASWANMLGGFFGSGGGFGGRLSAFTNSILGFKNTNAGIPRLGSGQVNNMPQNLAIQGLFTSNNAFEQVGGWAYDGLNTVSGAVGSAVHTVTSGIGSLIGNILGILPGEEVKVSSAVRWDGLTTAVPALTAAPLQVGINYYDSSNQYLGTQALGGTGGSPGGPATGSSLSGLGFRGPSFGFNTVEWVDHSEDIVAGELAAHNFGLRSMPFGLDPDDEWVPIEGSYVVPDTIDGIVPASAALVVQVSEEVDSGQVWFTKASIDKRQMIRQELIKNLPADKKAIIDASAGVTNASTADIEARLAGIAAVSGQMNWDYVPDLRTLNDSVVTQLNNWLGTDFGHDEAASALLAQRLAALNANSTVTALQAKVATLEAAVAGTAKVSLLDEFQRLNTTSLGSGWTQFYSGPGATVLATSDGQNAKWGTISGNRFCANLNTTASNTDYQVIKQVLSSSPAGSAAFDNYNSIIGRCNSTATNMVVYTVFGDGRWSLDYLSSGVSHAIASGGVGALASYPTAMTLACGDVASSDTTKFTLYADNTIVWSGNTVLPSSGSGYRGMGFGSVVYDVGGVGVYPGQVDSWTGRDQ